MQRTVQHSQIYTGTAHPLKGQNINRIFIKSIKPTGSFEGYASTFDVDSQKDIVMPGAFQHSLKKWRKQKKWPFMLWQHRMHEPIGTWTSMQEDTKGLYVKGQLLLNLQKAREVYTLLLKGILDGLSIGFQPQISRLMRYPRLRKIFQLHLIEVSIVSIPANRFACVSHIKSQICGRNI